MSKENGAGINIDYAGIVAKTGRKEEVVANDQCGLPRDDIHKRLIRACNSRIDTTPGALSDSTRFQDENDTPEGTLLRSCTNLPNCPLAKAFNFT